MYSFVENLVQLGMLGLGVSLLLICINYLKLGHELKSEEETDYRNSEALAVSSARSRTGP
jgi:hypothetical protein